MINPISHLRNLIMSLYGFEIVIKLDLQRAYLQILVRESDTTES